MPTRSSRSAAAEIAGAIGVWLPSTRAPAAFGLMALLLAVFPANIYMAIEHQRFAGVAPAWALYLRLPLQPLMIAWMWTLRE